MRDYASRPASFKPGDRVRVYDDAGVHAGTVVGFGTLMGIRQVLVQLDDAGEDEAFRAFFEWNVWRELSPKGGDEVE